MLLFLLLADLLLDALIPVWKIRSVFCAPARENFALSFEGVVSAGGGEGLDIGGSAFEPRGGWLRRGHPPEMDSPEQIFPGTYEPSSNRQTHSFTAKAPKRHSHSFHPVDN